MSDAQNDCIFCKIVSGKMPSEKVFENDSVLAFKDISPQAPTHVLIIPKEHVVSALEVPAEKSAIFGEVFKAAQHLATELGLAESGFRTVFNTGKHGCQTVFHMHLHLLGGAQLGGSMVG